MYQYIPKLHHAIVTASFCILCAYFYGRTGINAWKLGAWLFAVLFLAVMVMLLFDTGTRRVEAMSGWMSAFAKLDDEGRAAVAFAFPTVRYRMKKGYVREMFENTEATADHFRLFLQTSNERYISPRRDWQTADRPAWAWDEIEDWLQTRDYIVADSAAGSHSWLWKGNAYRHLMAYWLKGRIIEDFTPAEVVYE